MLVIGAALTIPLFSLGGALAQSGGYVIQRPGQVPTNVNPTHGGGYIMQTPGQSPSYANPRPGGGYIVQTPGEVPTNINPMPGGGYMIQTPGRSPDVVNLDEPHLNCCRWDATPMKINWHRGLRLWAVASVVWCAAVAAYIAFTPPASSTTVHVKFSNKETWTTPAIGERYELGRTLSDELPRCMRKNWKKLQKCLMRGKQNVARFRRMSRLPTNRPIVSSCFSACDPLVVPKGWEYQIPKPPVSVWQGILIAIGPPLFVLVLVGALGAQGREAR